MAITVSPTPNPNALKFTVGRRVDGPKTFVAGQPADDPVASALLAIDGVSSVFMTADFVTVTRRPEVGWETIAQAAEAVLTTHFG